jgi:hypothetical protein
VDGLKRSWDRVIEKSCNFVSMTIERTNKEIIIRISSSMDTTELQDLLNYIRYQELTSKSQVKQSVVDKLAASIDKKWWRKNAKRILK